MQNKINSPFIIILLFVTFLFGCSKATPTPAIWHLVIIGDSSLWKLGDAFAAQIEKDTGYTVVVEDFALPSLSAGRVLQTLETGNSSYYGLGELPEALKDADLVVMFVNPNDSITRQNPLEMNACFYGRQPGTCQMESYAKYIADLEAIWGKIIELRAGQPTILRATDLYNPLVEQWNQSNVFEACTQCWENLSSAARQAAEVFDIPFLSRLDLFNGPNHDEDLIQKGYIVSDGEHPSQLAAEVTAASLSSMGYQPLLADE